MRQTRRNTGENDQRNAVADAALGDLLTKPHQEHGTGHERNHGRKAKRKSRIEHEAALRLERDRDAHALENRERRGAVARVLSDLAPPRLAFLFERLERR